MFRAKDKISRKVGLPPGSLIHIGKKRTGNLVIELFTYNEQHYHEKVLNPIDECLSFDDKLNTNWLNIDGIHQIDVIEKIGKKFNLHPLLLEDILNTEHRPKLEDHEEYLFFTLKMLNYDNDNNEIKYEQISFILGSNYVISLQETVGDVFDPIRKRIREGKGRVRKKNADYLLYLLIDAIVDNYFIILDQLESNSDSLEDKIFNHPSQKSLELIQQLKKNILFLRKSILPLREAIGILIKEDSKLIESKTNKYFSDTYDNILLIIDKLETYREITTNLMDIYVSGLSNKMNSIMRVLTIITTIFIPLTFIVGIYGMNFKFMPELEWKWGYPIVCFVMLVLSITMIFFFKKKKWL